MNRRLFALGVAGLVSLGAAVISPASSHGPVGTARTELSLLTVEGNLDSVSQSVKLTIGSGLATTDPSTKPNPLASLIIAMARAEGLIDVNSAPFDIDDRAEGPGSDSKTDNEFERSFDYGDATAGGVVVGSRSVEVGDGLAKANLGQVLLSADALRSLIVLDGVTIVGVDDSSDASKASATQGVHIDSVRIFSIGQLLEQLGTSLSDLSIDSLLGLAEDILGPGSTQALRDALQDLTDAEAAVAVVRQAVSDTEAAVAAAELVAAAAESDVQTALGEKAETEADGAALAAAVAELTDGGIPGVTEPASENADATMTIVDLAVKYGVPLVGDPLTIAAAVSLAIEAAHSAAEAALADAEAALAIANAGLDAAEAALAIAEATLAAVEALLDEALGVLDLVRRTLEDAVGDPALVTLRDVTASVSAKAFDTSAEAVAGITWGSAEVIGQALPLTEIPAIAETLESAVDNVMAAIERAIPGLSLAVDIDFPAPSRSTGVENGYQVANAAVTAFAINISVGQSVLSATALTPSNFSLSTSVLSLTASASHRAGQSLPDPGDTTQGDSGDTTQGDPQDISGTTQQQGSPDNTSQPGPESSPQGSPPQAPAGDPTLPKTGSDHALMLLLAVELILLGIALNKRQRLLAGSE